MMHHIRRLALAAGLMLAVPIWHAHAQAAAATEFASTASGEAIVAHAPEIAWSPGPPSLPAGSEFALLEGNPAEAVPLTFRLKFPANYRVPPHWHSVIEHVTVLSGTLHIGMGEEARYSGGVALSAGDFGALPEKMVHYAWTGDDGAVFQLHSVGPWSITYVNPGDDPRNR